MSEGFKIEFDNGALFICEEVEEGNWIVTGELPGRVKYKFEFQGVADTLVFQYMTRFANNL